MLSALILGVITLSVIFLCHYGKCCSAEFNYMNNAVWHYATCHYPKCRFDKSRYVECQYADLY